MINTLSDQPGERSPGPLRTTARCPGLLLVRASGDGIDVQETCFCSDHVCRGLRITEPGAGGAGVTAPGRAGGQRGTRRDASVHRHAQRDERRPTSDGNAPDGASRAPSNGTKTRIPAPKRKTRIPAPGRGSASDGNGLGAQDLQRPLPCRTCVHQRRLHHLYRRSGWVLYRHDVRDAPHELVGDAGRTAAAVRSHVHGQQERYGDTFGNTGRGHQHAWASPASST